MPRSLTISLMLLATSCSSTRSSPSGDDAGPQDVAIEAAVDQHLPDAAPDQGVDLPVGPPCQPCTDVEQCCKPEDIVCVGHPDQGVVCGCPDLWDCDADGCVQPKQQPTETDAWSCQWSPTVYTCTQPGSASSPPDAADGWTCTYAETNWVCTTASPNPCNAPGPTSWTCEVDNANDFLSCTGGDLPPPPPPCSHGTWSCSATGQVKVCQRSDDTGLPTPGGSWSCHQATIEGDAVWTCHGDSAAPGPHPWLCESFGDGYRCTSDVDHCELPPDSTTQWQCYKGSGFGGTVCESVPQTAECFPGQKRWCDGLSFSSWGQVTCSASGTWATTTVNGKQVLDCQEPATAAVPATLCACYHYYFNPTCCERADCIVPAGGSDQICPVSSGQVCDYCNPQNPECVGAGAKCVVTNSMETFCAEDCNTTACPPDFTCTTVKVSGSTTKLCVPTDFSCYY